MNERGSLAAGVVVAVVVAVAAGGTLAGCNTIECGANTVEQDGMCVAMPGAIGAECGPGTHFNSETGRCESDFFEEGGGLCGEGTSVVVNDEGVRVCVGTGGGGTNCETALPCPPPTEANRVALCGRIFDLEDSSPLDDGNPGNGEPHKTVEIRILDPFAFIGNPNPPVLARVYPDSCGRYAIQNAPRAPAGHAFLAIAVDDIVDPNDPNTPLIGDNIVITGIGEDLPAGAVRSTQRAWILRRATDEAWSVSAGLTGMTFGRRGVYIPIFLGAGDPAPPFPSNPTEGVMTAIFDGSGRVVNEASDFYFDDTSPTTRRTVSPTRNATGRNGTGLYIGQGTITTFSGVGATPAGSCWAKNPAAAPAGAAFVQERTNDPGSCP
jgi:hypothetical protein